MKPLLFSATFIFSLTAFSQDFYYENHLKGYCDVGFKYITYFDSSRTYNLKFSEREKNNGKSIDPRPIIIGMWYPTKSDGHEKSMTYGEYLKIDNQYDSMDVFIKRLEKYNTSNSFYYMFTGSPSTLFTLNKKRKFKFHMNRSIPVHKNATPIEDRFPLVIYHAGLGGTLNDNTILCEYLASHGYVVVTSSFLPIDYHDIEIDWDLDRSTQDIDFILDKIKKLDNIDSSKIALIGHSFGAQAVLGYKADNHTSINCLINLESTMDDIDDEYPSGFEPLTDKLRDNNQNINVPMMIFASPKATFRVIDCLENSDRLYCKLKSKLSHNEYTSLTSYTIHELKRKTKKRKEIWEKYSAVNEFCLNFLNYQFYKGSDSEKLLFSDKSDFFDVFNIPKGKALDLK